MEKIQEIVSMFLFDDYLILGLKKQWINIFSELPKFDAMIDKNGKLILKSTKSIHILNKFYICNIQNIFYFITS